MAVAVLLAAGRAIGQSPPIPLFPRAPGTAFRVLSWNVSRSGFEEQAAAFRGLVRLVDPDILILDEVDGRHTPADVAAGLRGLRGPGDTVWHVSIGGGGGYQRGAVAGREPLETVPELRFLSYPDSVKADLMVGSDSVHGALSRSLRSGVAVHGAMTRAAGRRVLLVSVDLQCCGVAGTWEERRRTFEARAIRAAVADALDRDAVEGVVIAGDLNVVATPYPLTTLLGPYPPPHYGLIAADPRHRDGRGVWTWDGRGTPFESKPLDYQLYGPRALEALGGLIVDSEALTAEERAPRGIVADASRLISDHLPLVVDYRWR